MSSPVNAAARRPLRALIRWALALVALALLVRYIVVNVDQLRNAELSLRLPWLVGSLALLLAYLVGRALAWHDITARNGVAIPPSEAMLSWFLSLLGKYLPGKVFLLLGRLQAYERHGRSRGRVTFAFLQETATSLLSSVATILVALAVVNIERAESYLIPLVVALVLLLGCLHPRVLEPVINAALRIMRRPPVQLSLGYGDILRFVGIQTLVWLLFGGAFYAFVNAIYMVDGSDVLYVVAAISLATLVGIVALFAPSGLGVREGVLALLLSDVMPGPVAAVIALSSRVWVTAVEGLCIGVAAALAPRLKRAHAGEVESPQPVPSGDGR